MKPRSPEALADAADLLSGDEVIEKLLERPTLRRSALTCVLPAVRVGNEWRFRRQDLESWMERQGGMWRDVGSN
jgi:excisionase family DNA binding protein